MKFIDKLERKFGNRGIENLTIYIIVSYVLGYALMYINPGALSMLSLNVSKILHGQIWRLVTWIISPPSMSSPLWFVIAILFFYYPVSASLEHTWGKFRFTLYILSGIFFTVIAAFILHFAMDGMLDGYSGMIFSTYYISLSVFLAYSLTYPDTTVLFMFVIPIKMKWMSIVYVLIVMYDVVSDIMSGAWFMALPIIASLLNFIIFFLGTRNLNRYNPKEIHRRNQFKRAMGESKTVPFSGGNKSGEVTKHKCAVCGRTEKDDPNLEFRFCSKCNGNYEYCQDHLYTHIHKK
ncbi:hypothetical protein G4422_05160 [Blautia wexlerae]|uniref:hypothetical protein n=1 Tax=Blautia wexlerae TaxID=418240 RepID=UPI00156F2ECB|nr:hypothetical protein [Blautia wexlerae]NSE02837.1 hypothetical protein [Blautia wexlerae]NSF76470.1 hypothetical protein [Blautia wexlerae]